jgi:uncharacterized repeat protein (TIGR02543 family)
MEKRPMVFGLCAICLVVAFFASCKIPVDEESYTISFNANGGSGTMANQTIVSGESSAIKANAFTRAGYTFFGWATSAGATSAAYADGASYVMGDSDVTLYAVWVVNHTITFNSNGGAGTMAVQTIASGSSAILAANVFTRPYYSFAGWSTSDTATSATYTDKASYAMGTADVTFYAVWVPKTTGSATLESLLKDGYITMVDISAVTDGSYTQATNTSAGFVHNINAFSLGKYEVTYDLWYAVKEWAALNGYTFANAGREGGTGGAVGASPSAAKLEPVTSISWRDAIVWCNAYSEMAGETPVYYSDASYTTPIKNSSDGSYASYINLTAGSYDNPYINVGSKGYRLPTEGEWQYAASCKALYPFDYPSGADAAHGTTTGGVDIDGDGDVQYIGDVGWYNINSSSATRAVGTKAANKWGMYDMSGNVDEYCQDWFGTLPTTAQTNYRGPTSAPTINSKRITRDGNYGSTTHLLTVGYRADIPSYGEWLGVGFRVGCSR